jgi:hypothetical protein
MSLTQNGKFVSVPDYELQEMSAQIWRKYLTTPISKPTFYRYSSHRFSLSPSELLKDYEVTIFSVHTHYEYSKRYNSSFLQQVQHNHRAFFSTKFKAALYIYRHLLLAVIFQCFLPLWLDNPSGPRPPHCWGLEIALGHTHIHTHTHKQTNKQTHTR